MTTATKFYKIINALILVTFICPLHVTLCSTMRTFFCFTIFLIDLQMKGLVGYVTSPQMKILLALFRGRHTKSSAPTRTKLTRGFPDYLRYVGSFEEYFITTKTLFRLHEDIILFLYNYIKPVAHFSTTASLAVALSSMKFTAATPAGT